MSQPITTTIDNVAYTLTQNGDPVEHEETYFLDRAFPDHRADTWEIRVVARPENWTDADLLNNLIDRIERSGR